MEYVIEYNCVYGNKQIWNGTEPTMVNQVWNFGTSTCTATATTSPVHTTYGDWLVMNALILFCLAFIPIRFIIGVLTNKT